MDDRAPATVLVIDDNDGNRLLAQHTLEDEGYRVVLAANGLDGLTEFRAQTPDCVLLDVRMPGMDGFTVCEQMRASPHGGEVPILFLTAHRDIDTFDRALRAGGDDFVTKPVRPNELCVRVQAALKLRRMHVELREHYALLKQQRDDLIRLQLQKERLTSFIVHDLKNPVNSIDLHAQYLIRQGDISESTRLSATQIRAAARQLNRMIMNLLDVSKGDEGKLLPKRADVDLDALFRDIASELGPAARRRKVRLETGLGCHRTNADEELLRRLMTNLVENAIRHAPSESAVSIGSRSIDGGVELCVTDCGKGVPPEMRERIFDPFVQVEAESNHASESNRGLGLTFCKLAAEAHGGHISVKDGNPGAIFLVMISHE